jgi:uncharacterized protein (TIGR02996 family)
MTHTSPTLSHLIAAVLASPEDDMVRLVYADALDESAGGYDPRGEFIRVQVRRAALERQVTKAGLKEVRSVPADRERELFNAHVVEWFQRDEVTLPVTLGGERWRMRDDAEYLYVARGFVEVVAASLVTLVGGECGRCGSSGRIWTSESGYLGTDHCHNCSGTGRTVGILPAVLKEHPVTEVRVTDREPMANGEITATYYGWFDSDRPDPIDSEESEIPHELFRLLPGGDNWGRKPLKYAKYYHTRELALSALSAAVLKYAKGVRA